MNRTKQYGIIFALVVILLANCATTEIPYEAVALWESGNSYLSYNDYDRAIIDYTAALRIKPDYFDALHHRGLAYQGKGDHDLALADIIDAYRIGKDFDFIIDFVDYYLNVFSDTDSKYIHAINVSEAIIKIKPNLPDGYIIRGYVYANMKDYDRAIVDFNTALRIKPNNARVLGNRGLAYHDNGDLDQAITDYTAALRVIQAFSLAYDDDKDTIIYAVLLNRGRAYSDKDDIDKAIMDYTAAIQLNPQGYEALHNRGIIYLIKGEIDKAIADWTAAQRINITFHRTLFNTGHIYANMGEYDRALTIWTAMMRIEPYYYRTFAAYNISDYKMAIAVYTVMLRIRPDNYETFYNRGLAYYNNGNLDQAIADWETVLRNNPNNNSARRNLETARQQRGSDFVTAYDFFERGNTYFNNQDYESAIINYTEAIKLNPNFAEAHYNRGLAYYNKGSIDLAITDYTMALLINPDYSEVFLFLYNRGIAYRDKDDYERAIADWEAVLLINPNHISSKNNIERARQRVNEENMIISEIRFEGNTAFSARTLNRQLSLKKKGFLTAGTFQRAKLEADIASLTKYYHDHGYNDAFVRDVLRVPNPDAKGNDTFILIFLIEEGERH